MHKVTILIGPSGSGKSTWAHQQEKKVTICSADDYFMEDGEYRFNPHELSKAHGACLRKFVKVSRSGQVHTIVDNTNTRLIEVAPYLALAQAYQAVVECVLFGMDIPDETLHERNSHSVPLEVIKRQKSNILREVLCNWPPYWPKVRSL